MTNRTSNFGLLKPLFLSQSWHTPLNNNFDLLDATLALITNITYIRGLWENSKAVITPEIYLDITNGKFYKCDVSHTTAASPTTFATDRAANPTYWTELTLTTNLVSETWNDGAVEFVGMALDITDTASLSTSKAFQITVDTVPIFYIDKNGNLTYTGALSGAVDLIDNTFYVKNAADGTKRLLFDVSNISTGVDRTITWPDIGGEPLLRVHTQIVENKTIPIYSNRLTDRNVSPLMIFGSVANLVADVILTYTGGTSHSVAAGDRVQVQDGLFTYIVAASGATDHHLETAGGVKLYVPSYPVIDARQFNIVGGTSGDETTKIEKLRQHALANDGTYYDFTNLPTKQLRCNTPKWFAGVKNGTLDLRGISLYNTGAGTYGYADMDASLIVGSGPWTHDNLGTGQLDPAKANSGYLLQDVYPNQKSLTLTSSSDDQYFAVGDRVYVYSEEKQFSTGYPNNPANREFNVMSSVASGVLGVERPTTYRHRATAPEVTSNPTYYNTTCGRGRVINLDRGAAYTCGEHITVLGGIGVVTGAGTAGYDGALYVSGVQHTTLVNSEFEGLYVQFVDTVDCFKANFKTYSEMDKQGETVNFYDSFVNKLTQGTGIRNLNVVRGKLAGKCEFNEKNVMFDSVDLRITDHVLANTAVVTCPNYAKGKLTVKNCTVVTENGSGYYTCFIQWGNARGFTPDVISRELISVYSGNADYSTIRKNVDYGQVITLQSGTDPEFFFVEDWYYDGSNHLHINGWCTADAPASGARYLWTGDTVEQRGNKFIKPPTDFEIFRESYNFWHQEQGTPGLVTGQYNVRGGKYVTVPVLGYLEELTIDVKENYKGADTQHVLGVSNTGPGFASSINIDASIAGKRIIRQDSTAGIFKEDTVVAIDGQWITLLTIHCFGDGGTGTFTSNAVADRPTITVSWKAKKPNVKLLEC